jgi:hypothetical protein
MKTLLKTFFFKITIFKNDLTILLKMLQIVSCTVRPPINNLAMGNDGVACRHLWRIPLRTTNLILVNRTI